MTGERYVATTSRGEPAIRTHLLAEAREWARRLGGQVYDRETRAVVPE